MSSTYESLISISGSLNKERVPINRERSYTAKPLSNSCLIVAFARTDFVLEIVRITFPGLNIMFLLIAEKFLSTCNVSLSNFIINLHMFGIFNIPRFVLIVHLFIFTKRRRICSCCSTDTSNIWQRTTKDIRTDVLQFHPWAKPYMHSSIPNPLAEHVVLREITL